MLMQLFDEHGAEVWAYPRPKPKTSRLVGLGVTLALVVGALGLYAARRIKAAKPQVTATSAPSVEVPVAASAPKDLPGRAAVSLPCTKKERLEFLDQARLAVTAYEDPFEQESCVWMQAWNRPHPGALRPGDHPTVDLAMRTVDTALLIVRNGLRSGAGVFANMDPARRAGRVADMGLFLDGGPSQEQPHVRHTPGAVVSNSSGGRTRFARP